MHFNTTDISLARNLDRKDTIARFRNEFVVNDPNFIYLNGNSLGRLPRKSKTILQKTVDYEWGERLVTSWNEGWITLSAELGAKIARLIGAKKGEVIVADATSTNLFKLATAALLLRPDRRTIVSDVFNFPSDLYVLQGIIKHLGNKHSLRLIHSDDGITISPEFVASSFDNNTALVCLSHVAYKSAFMYDMKKVTDLAHKAGALTLWDLSHSAGAVPVDVNRCTVDCAVGCTYKYLNGGPGAPAFLYVRKDLQKKMNPPIWGWFGAKAPFAFSQNYIPAPGISRFNTGTPPILSMKALDPALDIILKAGIKRLRGKSIQQTDYCIYLAENRLIPLGFTIKSPKQSPLRGSHVCVSHPEAYRICRALIESPPPAVKVIPDFRAPDNIRLGIAPLYTTFTDIYRAIDRIREIVEGKIYKKYSRKKMRVT